MSSRTLNRKQFLVFTASAAAASVLAACGEDDPGTTGGSSGSAGSASGSSGSSAGGSASGSGGAGTAGSASGSGGAAAGSGGSSAGSGGANAGSGGASGGSGGASGGSGGSGGSGSGMCTGDIMVTSDNASGHTHTLSVTAAQITAGTEVTILSGGMDGDDSGHKHYVKITAADFTALKAGMEVKKKSCAGGDHQYVLKCGAGASAPVAPMCNDMCGDDDDMASACN
jgi:hypothetical protein